MKDGESTTAESTGWSYKNFRKSPTKTTRTELVIIKWLRLHNAIFFSGSDEISNFFDSWSITWCNTRHGEIKLQIQPLFMAWFEFYFFHETGKNKSLASFQNDLLRVKS